MKSMTKLIFLINLFLFASLLGRTQQSEIDSLKRELKSSNNDTISLILSGKLSDAYAEIYPDSALYYGNNMLNLARKLRYKLEEIYALCEIGYAQLNLGNYPRSLQTLLLAISSGEDKTSEKKILPPSFPPLDEFSERTIPAGEQRMAKLSRA